MRKRSFLFPRDVGLLAFTFGCADPKGSSLLAGDPARTISRCSHRHARNKLCLFTQSLRTSIACLIYLPRLSH